MRVKWIIAALVALAPIGCVEDEPKTAEAKPSAANKSPAPSERGAPSLPPPERTKVSDDTDPVIAAAQIASTRVAEHEEKIDASLTAMGEDLRTLSGSDYRAVDLTAEKLLSLVQLLRKSGERVLEKYPKVKAQLSAIVKANAGVKVGYGRAKEVYLEKADLERGDIRERYLALADLCDTFIRTNAERTEKYAAFASDLDKAVAKVERHVEFLKDFEAFLNLNPATSGAKDREEFIAALNRFADQILRFGEVLKQFRDKARDGAVSMKLRAEHDKAVVALARSAPSPMRLPDPLAEPTPSTESGVTKVPPQEPVEKSSLAAGQKVSPTVETRYVPVSVTRCVPTLVPVTHYTTRGCVFRRTSAVTYYEWRNRPLTETVYAPLSQ